MYTNKTVISAFIDLCKKKEDSKWVETITAEKITRTSFEW